MHTITDHPGTSEISILARILGNEDGKLPVVIARYVLRLGFSEHDKARMHDLAVRNQQDALAPGEKEEMLAYSKAGSLLGILKSKARRTLNTKPTRRTAS